MSKAWRPTEQEKEELGYLKVGGGWGQVSTGVKAVSLPGTQGIPRAHRAAPPSTQTPSALPSGLLTVFRLLGNLPVELVFQLLEFSVDSF